jgi:hypothetical protein
MTMRSGVGWFRAAIIVSLAVPVLTFWVLMWPRQMVWGEYVFRALCGAGPLATQLLLFVAAYRLTVFEPGVARSECPPCPRRLIRVLAGVGVGWAILNGTYESGLVADLWAVTALLFLCRLSSLGVVYLLFRYLCMLAGGASDAGLARSTTSVMYGLPIASAVAAASPLIAGLAPTLTGMTVITMFAITNAYAGAASVPFSPMASGLVICVAVVFCAFFGLWGVSLLGRYGRLLESACERKGNRAGDNASAVLGK